MIASKIRGVEFIAMNTDVQALHYSQAPSKLHIGKTVTRGLGAGMDPEMGLRAAEESQNEIREMLKGADMVFITCGLGGGTGSGASPYIAQIAKELRALTITVVTKPFAFEGARRKAIADGAFEKLVGQVDTIITIPNDRILQIIDRKTSLMEAFEIADDVLRQGVQGISELITVPGLINVDFADVRRIMNNRGSALMGIGRGHGENRATDAAKQAIASPLLEVSIDGARGILFTITGGSSLAMQEVSEAAKMITQSADPQAEVIFGAIIDEQMKDEVKITVIATGFDGGRPQPPKQTPKVAFSGSMSASNGSSFSTPSESVQTRTQQVPVSSPIPTPSPVSATSKPAPITPAHDTHDHQERHDDHAKSYGSVNPPIEPLEKFPLASPSRPASTPVEAPKPEPVRQTQPAANQPHVKKPVYGDPKPQPSSPPPSSVASKGAPAASDDDDLEIPAFIRKKMM
jgi:cell division protein FtsZ